MSETFSSRQADYLAAMQASGVQRQRIGRVVAFFRTVCSEGLEDLFLSQAPGETGPTFMTLWLFSKNYVMEASGFLSQDNWDLTVYADAILHWQVVLSDYEFGQDPSQESKLMVLGEFAYNITFEIRAFGLNCQFLEAILLNRITPNLVRATDGAKVSADG